MYSTLLKDCERLTKNPARLTELWPYKVIVLYEMKQESKTTELWIMMWVSEDELKIIHTLVFWSGAAALRWCTRRTLLGLDHMIPKPVDDVRFVTPWRHLILPTQKSTLTHCYTHYISVARTFIRMSVFQLPDLQIISFMFIVFMLNKIIVNVLCLFPDLLGFVIASRYLGGFCIRVIILVSWQQ